MTPTTDPSQYGEGALIREYFGSSTGHFLDLGAHDGVTFSTTWPLAESGWSGVLVEPSPASFVHLMRNYLLNDRVDLVNAAVIPHASDVRLRKLWASTADGLTADALSTLVKTEAEKWKEHPFYRIYIPALTMGELLHQFPGPYQFINLDCEGMNLDLLKALCHHCARGDTVKPEMVCVEIEGEKDMRESLDKAGLKQQRVCGGNLLAWI